jgi:N-acetyl-alpha-D-muramate 1-phosphate uridylyltransferase
MYKAMIFAAGLGTRFKPWTDKHPKALAIINGKSLLQRNIEYLQQFGITEVIVNVHHFADQMLDAIKTNKGWGSKITISDETEQVLETGGGLKKAAWYFTQNPFYVINADILTNLNLHEMMDAHQRLKPIATLAITNRPSSRHFLFDNEKNLCGWDNEKTGQRRISRNSNPVKGMAFSGIHIIEPAIFQFIYQKGKFSIVDLYLEISKTEIIKGFDHSESKLVDVGKPESVTVAEALFP